MMQLKPFDYDQLVCPHCQTPHPEVQGVTFTGLHVMADCQCQACGTAFYQDLPMGHALTMPISIGKADGRLYDHHPNANIWFADRLRDAYRQPHTEAVPIEKIVHYVASRVVLVNTLDMWYGHVLLKLFNVQAHLDDPSLGVVLIIPRELEPLVPAGCAEVWIVDIPLGKLTGWFTDFDRFVNRELERFEQVYLSPNPPHPNTTELDYARFFGVQPFDMNEFMRKTPIITFITREENFERCWQASETEYRFMKGLRRLGQDERMRRYAVARQEQLIKQTIRLIRQQLPTAQFNVIGIGRQGSYEGYARDLRAAEASSRFQIDNAAHYAQSHIVIGVLGSNMLVPSALAGASIDIICHDAFYRNFVTDLCVRQNDYRWALFLYRYLPKYATPIAVAHNAVAIIKEYDSFQQVVVGQAMPAVMA